MRDYRFFFPAGLSMGLKTTDFVSRETLLFSFYRCVSRGTVNAKKPGKNPALMFHVEQDLPAQLCERVVGCLYNQRRHDQQEQLAHEPAAMLQGQPGADQGTDDLASRHQQAQLPQQMTAVAEPHQRRQIAGDIDDLGRSRCAQEIEAEEAHEQE